MDSGGASPYLVFKSLEIRICIIILQKERDPDFLFLQPGNNCFPYVVGTMLVITVIGEVKYGKHGVEL